MKGKRTFKANFLYTFLAVFAGAICYQFFAITTVKQTLVFTIIKALSVAVIVGLSYASLLYVANKKRKVKNK